jgi:hypothetical protein
VNQQLQSRFADQNVEFLRQLSYFTPASLLTRENVNCSDIHDICVQYGLQPTDVVSELQDFTRAYRSVCRPTCGSMTDYDAEIGCLDDAIDPAAADVADSNSENDYDRPDMDDADDDLYGAVAERNTLMKWANNTFVKPCQLLTKLSGYPNLTVLYSIFCCLAVSSASAERALSKLKSLRIGCAVHFVMTCSLPFLFWRLRKTC